MISAENGFCTNGLQEMNPSCNSSFNRHLKYTQSDFVLFFRGGESTRNQTKRTIKSLNGLF